MENTSDSQHLLSILQDLEVAICCFTSEGIITYANVRAASLLGIHTIQPAENMQPDSANNQFHFLLQQASHICFTSQMLDGCVYCGEKPDQAGQWYSWKVKGVFNEFQQLEGFQAVGHELSYQKHYQLLVETWRRDLGTYPSVNQPTSFVAYGTDAPAIKEQENPSVFRLLTDTTPACIFIVQQYHFRYVNRFFVETMGYQYEELMQIKAVDLLHPDYRNQLMEGMAKLQFGLLKLFRQEMKVLPRDGSVRWLDFSASFFEWDGKPAILGAAYDVTRRVELQSALLQSENNFRQLADNAPSLIFVLDQGNLVYVNRAYVQSTGYSEEECLSMESWQFFHPQHWPMVHELTRTLNRGQEVRVRHQTRMLLKGGKEAWADFSLSPIVFNGSHATLGVAIDITEQKRAQLEVEYLSYHDKLTGLYNRAYLEERVNRMIDEENRPLSIIIVDVNGLKLVNDAFGHQYGDRMLKKAAHILSSNCRDVDLVARWGGDEFVVILPHCSEEVTRRICANILQECSRIKDFPVQLSLALGMATKTGSTHNARDLFKQAEDLMYRNKMLESHSVRSSFINSLEQTLWVRSHETQEHTKRLRDLVLIMGSRLDLPPEDMNSLTLLASLHDIGKIAIPNSILDKPGPLNSEEWELMKKHPETGYRIALSNPELSPIAEAILCHHERWDGSGYPLGIKERAIPLISRILSLADAYDVMITGRPYQAGISSEAALQEIMACAGTQFDPGLARIFAELIGNQAALAAR